jgi:hypothetical protein
MVKKWQFGFEIDQFTEKISSQDWFSRTSQISKQNIAENRRK